MVSDPLQINLFDTDPGSVNPGHAESQTELCIRSPTKEEIKIVGSNPASSLQAKSRELVKKFFDKQKIASCTPPQVDQTPNQ